MRKFPGIVGGLNAKQLMLSSGGEVTSTSCYQRHLKLLYIHRPKFQTLYFCIYLHWIMTICGGTAKYTGPSRPKARVRPK